MSEYTGQSQPNPLDQYTDQVRQLHGFTAGLDRYPGAIWPANNPVGTEYTQGMGNPSGPFVPAPSGRIDTAEHIMSLPGADLATGFVLGVDAGGNPLRVYHGTPHTFPPVEGNPLGAFDPAKIGTGEGAQAYGHGLYVAENEGVARGYRDRLAQTPMDGLNDALLRFAPYRNGGPEPTPENIRSMLAAHSNPFLNEAANDPAVVRDISTMVRGHDLDSNTHSGEAIKAASRLDTWFSGKSPGRMYEAEFHASPDELLDWDKPLSQQSPKVQQALAGLGIKAPEISTQQLDNGKWVVNYTDEAGKLKTSSRQFPDQATAQLYGGETMKMMGRDPTGENVYRQHSVTRGFSVRADPQSPWGPSGAQSYDEALAMVGGDKSRVLRLNSGDPVHVAEALRNAGIKGIRYLDAGSRNSQAVADAQGTVSVISKALEKNPNDALLQRQLDSARRQLAEAQRANSSNYVVFDPSTLNIVRRYGIGALIGGGAAAGAAQQQ